MLALVFALIGREGGVHDSVLIDRSFLLLLWNGYSVNSVR